MIKSHFIDILKTLSPEEISSFRNFIDSPYFNKRKKLVELFDIVKNYYPFFSDDNFTREKIFTKFYPRQNFSYAKINEGLSSLYKLSLLFLKQVSFEKNTVFPKAIFREELRKRSLKNIFRLFPENEAVKEQEIDSNLFLSQFYDKIETINYEVLFNKNNKPEKVRGLLDEINKAIVTLTNFYVSEVISLSVASHNYSLSYSEKDISIYRNIQAEGIISKLFEIVKPLNKYDFYIRLLNYYFEAIQDINKTEKYYVYKAKFFEFQKFMSRDDLEYHFSCLVSYCLIKKRNAGWKTEFTKEYLFLYEMMLKKKLFINSKSDFLLKEQYINMLVNYEAIKDKEKIKMMTDYIKFTHPDVREDLRNLSNAYYYFLNQSYTKTIELVKRINLKNKILDEKVLDLEIKALYEKGDFVSCLEKINLFRKQLRTNSLIDKKRIQIILLFLSSVAKLISINEKQNSGDASFLKDYLDRHDAIPSKEWLIEKCYELYEKPKQAYQY